MKIPRNEVILLKDVVLPGAPLRLYIILWYINWMISLYTILTLKVFRSVSVCKRFRMWWSIRPEIGENNDD